MIISPADWTSANQAYLTAALAEVRGSLERHVRGETAGVPTDPADRLHGAMPDMYAPPALGTLCAAFGLSPFERDILLLCAGVEMDSTFGALCATAQGDPMRGYPTFGLALAALPAPHWSALTPQAPLRRWRLIEIGAGAALTSSPLRIDERVLHYLAGIADPDERLSGITQPVHSNTDLTPSQSEVASRIVTLWSCDAGLEPVPVVQLCGPEAEDLEAIAAHACAQLHLNLSVLPAELLPVQPAEMEDLVRLWERESALSTSALLLSCHELHDSPPVQAAAVSRVIERVSGPLFVSTPEPRTIRRRRTVAFDVSKPTSDEQRALWTSELGSASADLNGQVDSLVAQFSLGATAIRTACTDALGNLSSVDFGTSVWDAARAQSRSRLEELAQRIEPSAEWLDLILPTAQTDTLRTIAAHVRQRARVYEEWGFASRGTRGLGISALFAGASGTGKTLAAEVIAVDLRLDLYRIDLSAVVSKYIGETEKNLRRVFNAAEAGGAILLFDEADALFGKRSEVKDSHDRYANIEVSYLLQRMEAYRGLAILTTNLQSALDSAFLRRLRFVVEFPFPDESQRAAIWRRIFPASTPTQGLETDALARLSVAGGNIRNIALHSAFLAADAGEPVRMSHLLRAAHVEYAKLDKSLTDIETGGWR